jgi:putative inorganic carbon (HCO3(-)) transporter
MLVAFVRFDNFLLLIVFLVPLSVPLYEFFDDLSVNLYLPSELLILIALLIFIIKIIRAEIIDKKILVHPVSIAIYINLTWILITAFTSSMTIISLKFFLSRLWFVAAFYFITAEFSKNYSFLKKYLWLFIMPLILIIFYTIGRHVSIGLFDQEASHYVMSPFFNDHTSYGAILAMILPVLAGFAANSENRSMERITSIIFLGICIIALTMSYSRAAWLSIIFAVIILIVTLLRIRFWILSIAGLLILYILFVNLTEILFSMGKNTIDSSASLSEHVQSISNITNDYSNVERLNRWNCALRMFKERPVFGWGPGTYQFKYAPYQISYEKTPISTVEGDRGNAHSEYLGPLCESGLIGSLSFIAIIVITLITGFRVYRRKNNKSMKIISLTLLLGLITYYVHGIMNNFLDTDKASALFWGYTAMLVAIDITARERD